MSSFGNRSPEPVSLYSIPSKGRSPGGFSPSKHRQANLPSLDETKQRHLRVFSESSVPSLLQTGLPNGHSTEASTGASNGSVVNGADVASQDRHSEPSRNWFWSGLTRDTAPRYADRQAKGLEALNEDGPAPSFEQPAVLEENIAEERRSDLKSPAAAAFNEQNPPSTGLTRARSTAQMHDLREQMQDLKGKISTLKKRAREDNMRRRSLQSLRTPSPFTVAEQWYTGASLPEDIQREESNSGPLEHVQSSGVEETPAQPVLQDSGHASLDAEPMLDKKEANRSLEGDKSKEGLHEGREAIKEPPGDLSKMVNGFPSQKERLVLADEPATVRFDVSNLGSVEEASPVDLESREDSLYGDQDYHETSTSPIVERHEDRPDAFDYEHFVLNSALGTYSGVGMRRSSSVRKRANSQSSESSVETTKPRNSIGDTPQADALSNGYHGRQNSVNSVSTDNTFATANEGADSEGGHDDWTFGHTKAGSRQVGADRKHKPNGSHESVPDHLVSNGIQKHGGKKHVASAQQGYVNGVNRKSPPAENGEMPQPPDLLTVLSSTGAWQEGAPPTKLKMGERDKEMVERLVKSLAKVCSEVDTLGPESSIYEARLFRRKLNDARRVLDGEMNGEAF